MLPECLFVVSYRPNGHAGEVMNHLPVAARIEGEPHVSTFEESTFLHAGSREIRMLHVPQDPLGSGRTVLEYSLYVP